MTRVPASLALLALRQSGYTLSAATLRSWVHRGHITRGDGGYSICEIREYIDARREMKNAVTGAGRACSVEDCAGRHLARGYCVKHYRRLTRHGDLTVSRFSDDVGYDGVHNRLRTTRGKADTHLCVCGAQAAEWAYDHEDAEEVVDDRGRVFSRKPDHYQPLCLLCHRRLDRGHAAA